MGKRINESFISKYAELEKNCCIRFGVASGGVTEYINRLNNARFAPGREEVLPRLVRYRNLRNKIAHEVGALRKINEIKKEDITWLKKFNKDVLKKRDPIATYLRNARRYARWRRVKNYVTIGAFSILAIIIIVLTVVYLAK